MADILNRDKSYLCLKAGYKSGKENVLYREKHLYAEVFP